MCVAYVALFVCSDHLTWSSGLATSCTPHLHGTHTAGCSTHDLSSPNVPKLQLHHNVTPMVSSFLAYDRLALV
jgi:hypothetical protein